MRDLKLFNTLTRSVEPFRAYDPDRVGIYSCGPTVYSRQHIGNLRTYLFSDLLKRTLLLLGYGVQHVMNITDVGHLTSDADEGDDKVERAAQTQGTSALGIARRWTEVFREDLRRLGVLAPDVWCAASDHVPEQIKMIEVLEQRGFVYRLEDGIYFDTSKDPRYGALGGLEPSAAHARVHAANQKRHPADFALWKLSPPSGPRRQLEWPSPWGVGFPGWHIECSAMATKYLGEQFDIHTGGIDHVAVHHTNEIAQSENALGVRPWVSYWLHAGWLLIDGAKVSKSLGHTLNLDDLADAGFSPDVFRYYTLTAHYRKPLEFGWEGLSAARSAYERLCTISERAPSAAPAFVVGADHVARFLEALANDLDGPAAVSVLWEAARDASLPPPERAGLVRKLGQKLGLSMKRAAATAVSDEAALGLLHRREEARNQRDFARADALRDELAQRGFAVEDTSAGPRLVLLR
ncbi:MAG TPA: cysteine--tRNA ligase [Polyangiaceae bacterium]|nr:cysteine--tRNA ligase [Polyangiaceae bacterium]